ILLGVITGAPSISLYFIEELEKYSTNMKALRLDKFLAALEAKPEVLKQSDWLRVRSLLQDQIGTNDVEPTLKSLIEFTPRVSQYSFRVARAMKQSKLAVRKKSATARAAKSSA